MKHCVDLVWESREGNPQLDQFMYFDTKEEAYRYVEEVKRPGPDYRKIWCKIFTVVTCELCGEEVICSSFTNTCDCGCDYNNSGQLLADRDQWGCETGETWTDCY